MSTPFKTSSFNGVISDIDAVGSAINRPLAEKIVIPDISDTLTMIDPLRAPFIRLLDAIGRENTDNWKHEWLDQKLKTYRSSIKTGSGIISSNSNTDLQTNDSDLLNVADILRLQKTDGTYEIVRVSSKTSATVYVVIRGQSGTTPLSTLAASDEIIHLGNAFAEFAGSPDGDWNIPVPFWNSSQTFKDPVCLSDEAMRQVQRGGNQEKKMLREAGIKHVESIERACWLGERSYNAGVRTMGGLDPLIVANGQMNDTDLSLSGNVFDMSSLAFNEGTFDKIADPIFQYGSQKKFMFASGKVLSKIANMNKAYLQRDEKASSVLGIEVQKIVTQHGVLSLVRSRLFDTITHCRTRAYIIDPSLLKKITLQDTTLEKNIQNNDEDGVKHQYISKVTLEARGLGYCHFILKGINTTIAG